jgi:putative nucleotidyltransferase with HDIG domain
MKRQEILDLAVEKLAQGVELRDTYTGEHSRRVTLLAVLLGQHLHLSRQDVELIRIGTPLHDLGKIGIADAILRKLGRLTPEEFRVMMTHTTRGAEIVERIPDLAEVVLIVRSHHERWDGGGYPDSLKGEEIPYLARVVAVADTFDAMTYDTPYRRGQVAEVAFAEIERQRGKQFDPAIVTAFLQLHDQVVEAIR